MCEGSSKSSTLKGLLYAPIKQEQYNKDYSTQVEDPAANVARKGRTIAMERSVSEKAVI